MTTVHTPNNCFRKCPVCHEAMLSLWLIDYDMVASAYYFKGWRCTHCNTEYPESVGDKLEHLPLSGQGTGAEIVRLAQSSADYRTRRLCSLCESRLLTLFHVDLTTPGDLVFEGWECPTACGSRFPIEADGMLKEYPREPEIGYSFKENMDEYYAI